MAILDNPENLEKARKVLEAALQSGKIGKGSFFTYPNGRRTPNDVFGHLYMAFEDKVENADDWLEELGLGIYEEDAPYFVIRNLNDRGEFLRACQWVISTFD